MPAARAETFLEAAFGEVAAARPTLRKKKRAAAATPVTLGLWVVQAVESPCAFPDPRLPLAQMMQRIA